MDWQEAQRAALANWRGIREAIGGHDEVELLTEINAVFSFCEKAEESAGSPIGRCRHCLAYQQFGGCRGISGEMSLRVAKRDWEGLTELVDTFIRQLEELDLSQEALSG